MVENVAAVAVLTLVVAVVDDDTEQPTEVVVAVLDEVEMDEDTL